MITSILFQPLLAGLSAGFFCLSACFPFMTPYIAAEHRSAQENFLLILQFLFGRFLGYVAFGGAIGYLGERFDEVWLNGIADLSLIVLSAILILYLLGLLKERPGSCPSRKWHRIKNPVGMGFLMGINFCPPFLLSVSYVFSLHSTLQGVLYFVLFFISSSLYFLPLIFVGMFTKWKGFQTVARVSGLITGIVFFAYGSYTMITFFIYW